MKKMVRKLKVNKETVRKLDVTQLDQARGGDFATDSCMIGSCVVCNAHETTMVW